METDSSGNTVAVAPFVVEESELYVLTDNFKLPITLNKDVEVEYSYESTAVSYNAETGFFTLADTTSAPIEITVTSGEFSRTVKVEYRGYNSILDKPIIEVSDETVELAATVVSDPGQDVETELAGYEVYSWMYIDIYRVDGKTDPVTFTLNLTYQDGKLFVVHFKDDGTVDYPVVGGETGGPYTITPSSFSLFAFGIYTGEDIVPPEPEPEPTPEPEPEPTPENPPAGGDDDEDLPPIIRPGTSSSSDDDTVTIVACAAAAAVAAILAVFLIYAYRKD